MLNNLFDILILIKFPLTLLIIMFWGLSFYWRKIVVFLNLKEYNSIQRVHENEVPRLGGLAIYIFLWIIWLFGFLHEKIFFNILVSSIPIIVISLKEDLYQNTSPKIRLLYMILSCFIFFNLNPLNLAQINLPLLGNLTSIYPFNIIFFSFSIIIMMNGMNLIDGMNGLLGFSAIFQLLSIALLVIIFGDTEMHNVLILFSIPIILFLIFNFPFGKVFMGDTGAYLYGFINSILVIYFFSKYHSILTWLAVLLLFYPCLELLFSFIRKIKNNQSPFVSDNEHLHTILYYYLSSKLNVNKIYANPMTTILLSIFWSSPTFLIFLSYRSIYLTILSLVFLTLVYNLLYFLIKKKSN